ncbi:cupin domain-containing protein [Cohnella fermenti]|uniref:AraC-type arabinose-binding/dimerisation domain-containing protein n=1 Tax=Cohnella fermenti TaxID=2565925 RepID=A0A4S4C4I6_9BACL|nr:hypothetical protein [Cohnella fermenti]THF82706.1 hypothetical protein E6C55_06470 [Cohnella fermenti]
MRHNAAYLGDHYFRDGEAFSIVQFPEPDRERMQFHTHDFVEICYVCSGSGYHVMNNLSAAEE